MRATILSLALAAMAPTTASAAPPGPQAAVLPGWMAGCWVEKTGERLTEECWMAPRGGAMLGAGRSGVGERVTDAENMRIETGLAQADGTVAPMVYRAAQRDGSWTAFVWSPAAEPGVVFTNPAHDYPQRIRYWREGASLMAEISLIDGSKARRWTYVRQGM